MKIVIALLVAAIPVLLFIQVTKGPMTALATTTATETFNNAVGAGSTIASVDLADAHWYVDTTDMTVARSGGYGNVTDNCTVGLGRQTVNCSGLAADGAATNLTVTYVTTVSDSYMAQMVKFSPLFAMFLILATAMGPALSMGFGLGMGEGMGTVIGERFLALVVGVGMIPVIAGLMGPIRDTYQSTPEFVGLTTAASVMPWAYGIVVLGSVIGVLAVRR